MTADPLHSAARAPASRPTAIEWWLALAVFLAGFGLRAAWPSRMAVEHFDEGVYASNVFFSGQKRDERYPNQHLYAPPLLPLLIEFTMLVAGPSNLTTMAVNIVAGSLTVPLLWWVARRWFGAAAGLSAATLVAVSDVHIFFSRTALTDVLLVFWMVAAVYLFWEALVTGSRLTLVASAAATGLAWWTKYNGWLPLAIGLAGVVPWIIWTSWAATRVGTIARFTAAEAVRLAVASTAKWGVVAVTAFLIWSPWLWSLQDKGGYRAVLANHRGYVVGPSGWFGSLSRQATKLDQLDGWLSLHGALLAVLVCLVYARLATGRSTWNILYDHRRALVALVAVFGLSLVAGSSAILGIAALSGIVWCLSGSATSQTSSPDRSTVLLAGWLLAAWYFGLSLTTPLYTPYPRLTLPWFAACWLGSGLLIGRTFGLRVDRRGAPCTEFRSDEPLEPDGSLSPSERARVRVEPPDEPPSPPPSPKGRGASTMPTRYERSSVVLVVGAGLIILAVLEPFAVRRSVPGWERRTGIAETVPEVIGAIQSELPDTAPADLDSFVIYTYGEPAALFQLRLAGVGWVRPVQDLNFAQPQAPRPPKPSFLIVGPRARLGPGFSELLAARRDRLRLIQLVPLGRSRLVMLDEATTDDGGHAGVLELYQIE
jgi:hypothetical protein